MGRKVRPCLVTWGKELRFHPKARAKPLEGFKQGSNQS